MSDKSRAIYYVAIQFLLIALILLSPRMERPYGDLSGPISVVGLGLIAIGSGTLLVSFLKLGRSLTASPIPREGGELVTTGMYSRVRHPIYFGLLTMSFGVMLDAGFWPQIIVFALLYVLLSIKTDFEEGLLMKKYPGYKQYAAKTPRFFPRLTR
ncbi:MAG: isoprenylcysteine carboxylmethyltransferase family protein [Aquiluna sp.]|nr:isoprenylcysteine carboxylmethyltransferase family protein [Aquiluna sp.]MCF8545737.1 isoprenylcysteine carboxylmethyltransferase family protein [Aquiluna sp.]